ncbi:hypothetical protein PDUR_14130 [Paenibacillus durus]|uniref:Ketosynthase family 3 (KS3) domain-containing protein n=2 Tax=Paenibacillus durus TaxID=44251 RepID=A0A089HQE9_PAEDU|nr:hypothetical protein PDUR_14130 [Paenibacillus durus]
MGIVSSIGHGIEAFTESLKQGNSGAAKLVLPALPDFPVQVGALLGEFNVDFASYEPDSGRLVSQAKKGFNRMSKSMKTTIIAAMEAWRMAELQQKEMEPGRIGIIVAGSNLTTAVLYDNVDKFRHSPEYTSPNLILQQMDTNYVGVLSEIFGIRGEGFTVGGASASGNMAIIQAERLIRHGYIDACLVAGPMADLTPMELYGYFNMGALGGRSFTENPVAASRPFDPSHEGFIYGQASGCLLLESREHAEKRGVAVWAEIAGTASQLDGNRSSDPSTDGEAQVMERCILQARKSIGEIQYINTHGTSTPLGDRTELAAIRQVFQEETSMIWLNSTKCLTGHCLYSAGIVEAIATVQQMVHGFLHPNINLEQPIDERFRFTGKTAEQYQVEAALSNSFGFGGVNSSILFTRG